jgi:hypothetical protein
MFVFFLSGFSCAQRALQPILPSSLPKAPSPQQLEKDSVMTVASVQEALVNITGCHPTNGHCEITFKQINQEVVNFGRFCSQLKGWVLHYEYNQQLMLTFSGNGSNCELDATSKQGSGTPLSVSCQFSDEQTAKMLEAAESVDLVKSFASEEQSDSQQLAKIQPLMKCLTLLLQQF